MSHNSNDNFLDLPQTESPAAFLSGRDVTVLHAYRRSPETAETNQPGQDYVSLRYDPDSSILTFAVSDGVSQSFFGEIAASFLARKLAEWLLGSDNTQFPVGEGAADHVRAIAGEYLSYWTAEAQQMVINHRLSEGLEPYMLTELEQRRQYGSETMFVAGRFDIREQMLTLIWLGDSKFQLWYGLEQQPPDHFVFDKNSRWSTTQGPRGPVQVEVTPFRSDRKTCLIVHSDGVRVYENGLYQQVYSFDGKAAQRVNEMLDALGTYPDKDDISLLAIAPHAQGKKPDLPKPQEPFEPEPPTASGSEGSLKPPTLNMPPMMAPSADPNALTPPAWQDPMDDGSSHRKPTQSIRSGAPFQPARSSAAWLLPILMIAGGAIALLAIVVVVFLVLPGPSQNSPDRPFGAPSVPPTARLGGSQSPIVLLPQETNPVPEQLVSGTPVTITPLNIEPTPYPIYPGVYFTYQIAPYCDPHEKGGYSAAKRCNSEDTFWLHYVLQSETVSGIAEAYHVSSQSIMDFNRMTDPKIDLKADSTIKIPIPKDSAPAEVPSEVSPEASSNASSEASPDVSPEASAAPPGG